MTDLELTIRCAKKMGYTVLDAKHWAEVTGGKSTAVHTNAGYYDPLADHTQLMAMLRRFPMEVSEALWHCASSKNPDFNRAACECVAKL